MPTTHNSDIYGNDPPGGIDVGPAITLQAAAALIFGKTTTTDFAAVGDFQVPIGLGTQTVEIRYDRGVSMGFIL